MDSFQLKAAQVDVWVAGLDVSSTALAAYADLLAADERERVERLHFDHLRTRFIAGRGILRSLLAGYLHVAPESIVFSYGEYGKPLLAFPDAAAMGLPAFAFNLAHTQSLAAYAFASSGRIGVDIECVRPVVERDQIVKQYFSSREWRALAALPIEQRDEAFYLGWTRKEAYLKALGAGLVHPLDSFNVSLTPGDPALLEIAPGQPAQETWSLLPFVPAPGCHGAVALEGTGWLMRLCHWPDSRQ